MLDLPRLLSSVVPGEAWSLIFPNHDVRLYATKDRARMRRRLLSCAGVATALHRYEIKTEEEALRAAVAEVYSSGTNPFVGDGRIAMLQIKNRLAANLPSDPLPLPLLDDDDFDS